MANSFFYLGYEPVQAAENLVGALKKYSGINKVQVYVINSPLGDAKYASELNGAMVILVPKHKIMVLNFSETEDEFEDFYEDFVEDLASISDKYNYKGTIGRVREWRKNLVSVYKDKVAPDISIKNLFQENFIESESSQKKVELLISLLTGSINDIDRVKDNVPDNILDKIKQKILLFDGDQTRFIFSRKNQDKITIQGLSGTGKTELLLHKLKDIYTNEENSKVMFTCHNKILAASLRDRIPDFFNFMKVEEQIKWNERLWCVHAWGGARDQMSGAYRYICYKYELPFRPFSYSMPFSKACGLALASLTEEKLEEVGYIFDYVLIDESQDFPDEFIKLCMKVTRDTVYIAGDIFQSIFDDNVVNEVKPDYLLSKCYRTDPRTLMFSHALGMGLFEDTKLRWLEDNEWEQCGYLVSKSENGIYELKREPLKRFEDLKSNDITSMEIIRTNVNEEDKRVHVKVLDIVRKIRKENPTVSPDDIGIIFIGSNKSGYRLSDTLAYLFEEEFNWKVNKAYDSKNRVPGKIFISNKNNVKGLEFPFVICVSDYLSKEKHERNALYMMLTRSFIQSYLLIDESYNVDSLRKIEDGLKNINENGFMKIKPPPEPEKLKIVAKIDFDGEEQSVYDLVYSVFDELDCPPLWRDPIFALVKTMKMEDIDYESVRELVSTNLSMSKAKV